MKINWLLLVLIFSGLAFSFVVDLWGVEKQREHIDLVDSKFIDKSPVAKPVLEPKTKLTQMQCNTCHRLIVPAAFAKKSVAEHPDIVMDHGRNDTCLECHSKDDRDQLVGLGKQSVPFSKSEILCGKCHGTKLRDWNLGVHGRLNGHWNKDKGVQTKLTCVACHNPHSPKFKPLEPAPAPHYLHTYLEDLSAGHKSAH